MSVSKCTCGFIPVDPAQHEALMAAKDVLQKMLFDFANDDVRREAYEALAALRSAGIDLESKT